MREAFAEMIAEAPAAPSFERLHETPGRVRRLGPIWAVASFAIVMVLIGVTALIRPAPPVVDILQIGLVGNAVIPTHVPDGLAVLEAWSYGDPSASASFEFANSDGSQRISIHVREVPASLLAEPEMAFSTLETASQALATNRLRVRDRDAIVVFRSGASRQPSETEMLVIESGSVVSEIRASGFDFEDVRKVAEGLRAVDTVTFRDWVLANTYWDLKVTTGFLPATIDLPALLGDADTAELVSFRSLGPRPLSLLEQLSGDTRVGTDGGAPVEAPIVLYLEAAPGVTPERMAEALSERVEVVGVEMSPARAVAEWTRFFDLVSASWTSIGGEPPIHQAAVGPEPEFDVSVLGVEHAIATSTDGAEVWSRHGELRDEALQRDLISIGSVDGNHLLVAVDDDEVRYSLSTPDGVHGRFEIPVLGHFFGRVGEVGGPGGHALALRVPLETAVLQFVPEDGEPQWQRPVAGHGIFAIPGRVVDTPMAGEYLAYAADGSVLWRQSVTN
ncbi:MAG: hypothetical protein OEX04_03815 [Acidimicrobiia bacterium]|nr:hypothetical protein [Acidimicrobiia bacterium]